MWIHVDEWLIVLSVLVLVGAIAAGRHAVWLARENTRLEKRVKELERSRKQIEEN